MKFGGFSDDIEFMVYHGAYHSLNQIEKKLSGGLVFENPGPFINVFLGILVVFLVLRRVFGLLGKSRNRGQMKLAIPAHWSTTEGQIIAASVEKIVHNKKNDNNDEDLYFPRITFEYTVDGHRYTGIQAVGKPENIMEKASHLLTHFQTGSEVLVYYDPQKPSLSRFSVG
ncbi:MAG: DUF3592 domain-containing protein [Anaerolineales bacterium]|nr:DUF3592 domain-containing protein [Anaerolineales bacterium]